MVIRGDHQGKAEQRQRASGGGEEGLPGLDPLADRHPEGHGRESAGQHACEYEGRAPPDDIVADVVDRGRHGERGRLVKEK
jgi:hypothetical protein